VFNILGLGETLSLKLDGGASQSNVILNLAGTHFLGTPFSLGLSIFHTTTGVNAANILPGLDDLIEVFSRRSTGVGFSGAYALRDDLEAGLRFEVAKDLVARHQNIQLLPRRTHTLKLMQSITLDRTSMSGHDARGYRLKYGQEWKGNSFLKSPNSVAQSAKLAFYLQDPFSRGRNSLAFRLQGGSVRQIGSHPVYQEDKFYLGNDIVRGFKPGSLGAYSVVSGAQKMALQSTAVDTVLGFSAEYRIPIQGALSSVGFFDLGWSRVNPQSAVPLGAGTRLIEKTNGIIRGSLGGELRLQLPVLHQPARLIFSWNLLRLSEALVDSSLVLRLADPQTALSFALGTGY
jgi:outer membrane protein assembly factor BamA